MAANDNGEGDVDDLGSRRLELELGYGLSAFDDRFTWTPEAGFGLSDTGRDYGLGWRLVRGGAGSGPDDSSLELAFEARRRESAHEDTPRRTRSACGSRLNSEGTAREVSRNDRI